MRGTISTLIQLLLLTPRKIGINPIDVATERTMSPINPVKTKTSRDNITIVIFIIVLYEILLICFAIFLPIKQVKG